VRNVLVASATLRVCGDSLHVDALACALEIARRRPAVAARFARMLEWDAHVPSTHAAAARIALEIALLGYAAERDPAPRLHLLWCMRGLAISAGRRDVMTSLRDADSAGKAWKKANAAELATEAAEHLRIADARVAEAAALLRVSGDPSTEEPAPRSPS
jgi:hypothetical protein